MLKFALSGVPHSQVQLPQEYRHELHTNIGTQQYNTNASGKVNRIPVSSKETIENNAKRQFESNPPIFGGMYREDAVHGRGRYALAGAAE